MPLTARQKKNKRKKLKVPQQLLDSVSEIFNDSDTVVGEVNERDIAFIDDVTDDTDEGARGGADAATSKSSAVSKTNKSSSAGDASKAKKAKAKHDAKNELTSNTVNTHRSKSTTSVTSTDRTASLTKATTTSSPLMSITVSDNDDVVTNECSSAGAITTATGGSADTSKGAVPKTKAASKQYASPNPPTQSWFDQTEQSQREEVTERPAITEPISTFTANNKYGPNYGDMSSERERHVAFYDDHDQVVTHRAVAHTLAQSKQHRNAASDQQRLVRDTNINALVGDSAYFRAGE